jgi:hypothetical protein
VRVSKVAPYERGLVEAPLYTSRIGHDSLADARVCRITVGYACAEHTINLRRCSILEEISDTRGDVIGVYRLARVQHGARAHELVAIERRARTAATTNDDDDQACQ